MFFDTEVILLKALEEDKKNHGITYNDVRNYCDKLKQKIFDSGAASCVYFGISNQALENAVDTYPQLFRIYNGKYYKGVGYNSNYFGKRIEENFYFLR